MYQQELGQECRFKTGDIVRFVSNERPYRWGWKWDHYLNGYYGQRGAIGTVTQLFRIVPRDCIEYEVVADGDDVKDYQIVSEDDMREADIHEMETVEDEFFGKPAFQLGDAVSVAGDPNGIWIVREVIVVHIEETAKYMYEVCLPERDDKVCTHEESALEFLYHDSTWKDYFMELGKNNLPEWKGQLYNFAMLRRYKHYWRELKDVTLPIECLAYILAEYSIAGGITPVFLSRKNEREVRELFHLNRAELNNLVESIFQKIENRNICDIDPDFKKEVNDRRSLRFTDLELSILSEVDKRDITFGRHRDHFPVEMTDVQIMQAIKEAYETAGKIGNRKIEEKWFKRYRRDKETDPVKGHVLYEGMSKDGLIIRFWYNFDLDLIETAYPVISITEGGG